MAYAHFVEGCLATSTEIFGVSFIFAALRSATGKQRRFQRRAALSIAVSQSSHLATSKNGHREDEEGGIKTGFIRSLSLMGAPWRRFSALMRLKRRPVN